MRILSSFLSKCRKMAATQRHEQELKQKSADALKKATDPMEILRLKCLSRGASGIKGIGRLFRIIDDDGSKGLDFSEFKKCLDEYGMGMTGSDMKDLFQRFDKDGNGTISFDEFLQSLRPPMSQSRKDIILKAFKKLDKTDDGVVTVQDLKGVYNARQHKRYMNGDWTEEQVFVDYLKTFDSPNDPDGKVTQEEFINYYCGLSASIDNDAYFDLMMRNAWKL